MTNALEAKMTTAKSDAKSNYPVLATLPVCFVKNSCEPVEYCEKLN